MSLFLLCLLLGYGTQCMARASWAEVDVGGPRLFDTSPGEVINAAFTVTNRSADSLMLMEELDLPDGWRPITPSFPFPVQPLATELRLAGFLVPRNANAGRYDITYRLFREQYPGAAITAKITVVVQPRSALDIVHLQAPQTVIAGEPYTSVFTATNNGNITQRIRFETRSLRDLAVRLSPEQADLRPGESIRVTLAVTTPAELSTSLKHRLDLFAMDPISGERLARARSFVNLVARVSGNTDVWHRIPSVASVSVVGSDEDAGAIRLQGALFGSGPVSPGSDDQLSFLFRGPDTTRVSPVFSQYDEYFIDYSARDRFLRLGDGYFSLSRLTEDGIQGRGIQGRLQRGALRFHGYTLETVRGTPETAQTALQIERHWGKQGFLGLNLFNEREADRRSHILSIRGQTQPWTWGSISFETALGHCDDRNCGTATDSAYQFGLHITPAPGAFATLEYLHAGPEFPGDNRNREYLIGSFHYPLRPELSLNASFRDEEYSLDDRNDRDALIRIEDRQIGLRYRFARRTAVSLHSRQYRRDGSLASQDSGNRQSSHRLRLTHAFNRASINTSIEMQQRDDDDFLIYEGSGLLNLRPRGNVSGFVRYSQLTDTDNRQTAERDRINAGLSGRLHIGPRTEIDLGLELLSQLGQRLGDRTTYSAGIRHRFDNKLIARAAFRHTQFDTLAAQDAENAFLLALELPLALPVAKRHDVGFLRGSVDDLETGQPVSGAILRLSGATAVTDSEGGFVFPALTPGTYYLSVARNSIGQNRIPTRPMPMAFVVQGGGNPAVQIDLVTDARIGGQVSVFRSTDNTYAISREARGNPGRAKPPASAGQKPEWDKPLANALIQISREDETIRQFTDRHGRFEFDSIRPGTWTVEFLSGDLPPQTRLTQDRFELNVAPGGSHAVKFDIMPVRRTLRLLEQGGTLIEE